MPSEVGPILEWLAGNLTLWRPFALFALAPIVLVALYLAVLAYAEDGWT